MRRSHAGAILAILAALALARSEAEAGCHRDVDGALARVGPMPANLQSLGALGAPRELVGSPAPLADPRGGCTGPLCSSNADPVSAPSSFVPARLKTEWVATRAIPPAPDPTMTALAPEGPASWSNPPAADVFHPPRGPVRAG